MAMLASMSFVEPTAAGSRALLRNAAGVVFGVALGLLTLGASKATSHSSLPELPAPPLMQSIPATAAAAAATSDHPIGVDTVPSGLPRTEYADAIVWSRAFWL